MNQINLGAATLYHADCRDTIRALPDNSIDSIVTDPPYALVSITKRFGGPNAAPAMDGVYKRSSAGFMGKQWDTGETAFAAEFWAECLRVLKPGGYVLAFSGTRTYHRLACAIEDAGFEVRDIVSWIYGSGFPKSHDVSKGIDKAAGAERVILSERPAFGIGGNGCLGGYAEGATMKIDAGPASTQAAQWQGWGTALKPACEPICMARKPLSEKTVASNVLKHGTGAINVDGCRVDSWTEADRANMAVSSRGDSGKASTNFAFKGSTAALDTGKGRWPANLIHDGSEEVIAAFPDAGGGYGKRGGNKSLTSYGFADGTMETVGYGDAGSAARFFYSAKASKADRAGSKHPTVKPISLMRYLIRMVTPPGGTVLDPFAGSGTTGAAAIAEGFNVILCERESEYAEDIKRRLGEQPMQAAMAI